MSVVSVDFERYFLLVSSCMLLLLRNRWFIRLIMRHFFPFHQSDIHEKSRRCRRRRYKSTRGEVTVYRYHFFRAEY